MKFVLAAPEDAEAIAALHAAVATDLTARFGKGHWSSSGTAKGVLFAMKRANVSIAKQRARIAATFALSTRKPWAIDVTYFTPVTRPLYLTSMAVDPESQGKGLGARCIEEAVRVARAWPADAIRLDAYDHASGAGAFYAKCGFAERGRVVYRGTPLAYYEMIL